MANFSPRKKPTYKTATSRPSKKKGEEIEVTIHDLAFGGEGVGRVNGRVVFVPMAAIGDRVVARVVKKDKKFLRAEIVDILEASPDRVDPPCAYYKDCGGCVFQHISYKAELEAKEDQVRQTLKRLGGIDEEAVDFLPILAAQEPYGYRNRISVHVEGRRVGFRARDKRTLIDIQSCMIANDKVNQRLQQIRRGKLTKEHYSVRDESIPSAGFHQSNSLLIAKLSDAVKATMPKGTQCVVEGYAGSGIFTRLFAESATEVHAIESDPRCIEKARKKAVENIFIHEATVEEALPPIIEDQLPEATHGFIDPPREGLSSFARQILIRSPFATLGYLSCNPATLARDLKELSEVWEVISVQPIDLFPRTAHVEVLVQCRHRG